ncbi:putative glycosyl transferase [Crateriforma conspicua]|uniref:Putative glycosyl transferase n=1 Tax=Crateriforma conspicua TaxID=2527996 RepID=A0A5C6FVR0_9PLAN|nr:glycosyltransferase family 4 protein [Crateriforma conspicua]TWU67009.1 putative glycosyl transferase [Crateriforma conspicua]
MRTLWVVSELYAPEDASTAHLVTQIAEGLFEDFSVKVICAQPTYNARGQKAPSREVLNGVVVSRIFSTTFPKDRLVLRFLNVATACVSFALRMLLNFRRGDAVLVVTNPPPLPFLASLAARVRGAQTCLLIHDVYPDVFVPTGFLKNDSFVFRGMNWATAGLYRTVDAIIVLGRDMKRRVLSKSAIDENKVFVVQNWADIEMQRVPDAENSVRKSLKNADSFIVQYSGNMGRTHDLNVVAEAAEALEHRGVEKIHWMICGWGAGKVPFQRLCERKDLKSVAIYPPFPRELVPQVISLPDVAIISFVEGMSGISVPSRMYNILACGCPIIAVTEKDSELALAITEDRIGWVLPPGDAESLANLVERISRSPDELEEIRKRCIDIANMKYSWRVAIRQYANILHHI